MKTIFGWAEKTANATVWNESNEVFWEFYFIFKLYFQLNVDLFIENISTQIIFMLQRIILKKISFFAFPTEKCIPFVWLWAIKSLNQLSKLQNGRKLKYDNENCQKLFHFDLKASNETWKKEKEMPSEREKKKKWKL